MVQVLSKLLFFCVYFCCVFCNQNLNMFETTFLMVDLFLSKVPFSAMQLFKSPFFFLFFCKYFLFFLGIFFHLFCINFQKISFCQHRVFQNNLCASMDILDIKCQFLVPNEVSRRVKHLRSKWLKRF